jgi:uncharacterized membrane protein YeaQ/YmgE (transglycosylase-associated protein family)
MNPPLRRAVQISFGLAAGMLAQQLLPGHHPVSVLRIATLSLVGAAIFELVAERTLPADALAHAGFVVTALGAMAMMLADGIAFK